MMMMVLLLHDICAAELTKLIAKIQTQNQGQLVEAPLFTITKPSSKTRELLSDSIQLHKIQYIRQSCQKT